jgi:hypothetical protein
MSEAIFLDTDTAYWVIPTDAAFSVKVVTPGMTRPRSAYSVPQPTLRCGLPSNNGGCSPQGSQAASFAALVTVAPGALACLSAKVLTEQFGDIGLVIDT